MSRRQLWQAGFITLEEYLVTLRERNMFLKYSGRCDRKWCPRRATRWVRDIEEIVTPYLDGTLVETQRQVGEIRGGCSWHPPAPSRFYPLEDETEHSYK